jgi:queuine/archaeosine tRNA-ribosyltransferase
MVSKTSKLVNFNAGTDKRNKPSDQIEAILFNVAEHGSSDRRIENALQLVQSIKYDHMGLDSGGYQILKAEQKGWAISFDNERPAFHGKGAINLVPRHVMETAAIFEPDMVIGLDHPLNPKIKTPLGKRIEFINKSVRNISLAHESAKWHQKLCPHIRLFIPIQCYELEQLDLYFNGLRGVKFDGVSIPIRNMPVGKIVAFLHSFYQRGIRCVHLLGTSRLTIIALGAYMARHLFEWVSIDSTTWNTAAIYSGFINPKDLVRIDLRPNGRGNHGHFNDCTCPYCNGLTFPQVKGLPLSEKRTLLRKHNWWVIDAAFKDMYEASTSLANLECSLKSRAKNQREVDELLNALSSAVTMKAAA